MTRGKLFFGWFSTDLWEESQRTEEFGIFYCENRLQLTAVYRHRREV